MGRIEDTKSNEQVDEKVRAILDSYSADDAFVAVRQEMAEIEQLFEINEDQLFEDYIRLLKEYHKRGWDLASAERAAHKDALAIQLCKRDAAREKFLQSHQRGEE